MAKERIRAESTTDNKKPEAVARDAKVTEFLNLARQRFATIAAAEADLRNAMMDDLQFRSADQWSTAARQAREADHRPCLTINRLPQFIRQVTNAQRASNLAVKVAGVDDSSDKDTAEVIQGLIRYIERQSDASVAYGTAGEHQATMGRGYWRVVTEYDGPKSFVQTIRIKRVRNPFTVFMDQAAQEADGSDANYAFIIEDLPKPEFKARYGEEAMKSLEQFQVLGTGAEGASDWMPTGKVRIAEYWYVESEFVDLLLVELPRPGGEPQEVPMLESEYNAMDPEIKATATIKTNRKTEVRTVRQALISGADILEGNADRTAGRDWPGQWIPIVPVLGDEIDINGKLDLRGMVRDAKDPQRLYNIQQSTLAETLAMVPRVPWVGYEGQFEGHEAEWRQANRKAFAYLEVKPITLDGVHPAPLPQRVSASADIGSIMAAINQSDQDLKATMGLYEPSLGIRQSSGQSGKAIEALKKQGEQANSNFLDNMSRSIRFTGRLIIDLIPKIYDARRVVRIIGTDDVEKTVMVHASDPTAPKAETKEEMPKGIDGIYDVGVGRFDVVVSAGPSLESKRAEAFSTLNTFIQAYPAAFPLLGDLLVGNLDWPGAKAAAERLKRAVPPQVLGDETGSQEIPPQVAAQMQELMQQLEATGLELSEAKQIIQSKQMEAQVRAAAEREKSMATIEITRMKAEAEIERDQMKAAHEAGMARLEAELDLIRLRLDHAHDRAMSAQDRVDNRADAVVDRRVESQNDARDYSRKQQGKPPSTTPVRPEPVDITHAT